MNAPLEDMNAAQIIQWLADREIKAVNIPCTVKSVDKEACTIQAWPFDVDTTDPDALYFDNVSLRAAKDGNTTGIVVFPKAGSQVLVSRILKMTTFYVSAYTDIDEILITITDANGNIIFSQHITPNGKLAFNGGNNGGLVMIAALVEKINALESRMNSHQHLYIPYPGGSAGPPVATAADPTSNPAIVETVRADIEDTDVTH